MRKIMDKMLKLVLAFVLVFSTLSFVTPGIVLDTYALNNEYEIYPKPHNMTYKDDEFVIRNEVNVVVEDNIDEVTLKRLNEVFAIKNKKVTISNKIAEGKTNVLLGIYGSNGYADQYAKEHYSLDASLFDHFGAYFLASDNGVIVALGCDSDGVFYALTSLKHIFNQMDGSTIRNFEMRDYADANIRGFIEGYYGIPWSNDDRMSLMKFGGDFKMTSYIFAPKDDPYHSARWRDPYPQSELDAIKEMAQVGNESKCRFVWTIHPFMNGGITASSYDADIQKIIAKFEQLYEVGVRQFGVLGDDAGNLPRAVVINVMNDLQKWADSKGDVYNLVFCPQGYNHSWQGNYSELNELDAGFPEDVQIFWTGEAVCQPVEQKTLDHFRRYNVTNGKTQRRAPLFWLNWPVNDINHGRMLMGKGSLLHTDINVDDIYGVVTNPMQEAEPSKVALFAVADYTWNVKGFDDDKSWADSFKYIDENASEQLHTLAKHMSNPQPNGHGLVLAESEELQPLLNEFKAALNNGGNIQEVGNKLLKELDVIINACDDLHKLSTNEALKDDLLPYTNSLRDLCQSISYFILTKLAVDNADMYDAFNYYTDGSSKLAASQAYTKKMVNGSNQVVSPGSTHLIPLADQLNKLVAEPVNNYVAENSEQKLVITGSSNYSTWYSGAIGNITDGDASTFAWHDGAEGANDYFQINLSKPTNVYGINILNGTTSKNDDTFGYAKVYYQTEGSNEWKQVNSQEYGPYAATVSIADIDLKNVVAIRYQCSRVGGSGKWTAMREFSIVTEKSGATAYTNVDAYQDIEVVINKDNAYLTPTEDVTLKPGEYIGIKLDRIHEIQSLESDITSDQITLEIGKNEYEMITYPEGEAKPARYIRLINHTNETITFDINELSERSREFGDKEFVQEQSSFSIYDGANTPASNLFDGDRTTQVIFYGSQTAGRHFVYDLGQIIPLKSLKVVCRDSEHDWPRHGKVSVSYDGNEWIDIMEIGSPTEELEGEANNEDNINDVLPLHETSYNAKEATNINKPVKYIKFEITKTKTGSDKWVRFQEFEINGGQYIPTVNDPTYQGTGKDTRDGYFSYLTDGSLSTSFIPEKETGNLIYNVSENNDRNKIKIIQNANAISNAKVTVYTLNGAKEVGYLASTLNEFIIEEDEKILSINIEWENTPVNIAEIMLMKASYNRVDESVLEDLAKNMENTSSWTTSSAQAYIDAYNIGDKILTSDYPSQAQIDSAVDAINKAIENKEMACDSEELDVLKAQYSQYASEDYTSSSYRRLAAALSSLDAAIANPKDVSVAKANGIKEELEAAKAALVYNPSAKENAIVTVEDEEIFKAAADQSAYTTESWKNYDQALVQVKDMIEDENATPAQINAAVEALTKAKAELKEASAEKPFPFEDVFKGQWYYEYVDQAYQLGLMTGATETLFKPTVSMNRGMVAIVLHRMEGAEEVAYAPIFPDVYDKQYFTTAVMWAKQTGIITGYNNGTFMPLKNVTREEMATMIQRFAKYKVLYVSSSKDITYFQDYADISTYAKAPIQWCVENGVLSGKFEGTKVDPLGTASRAECAKMLVQAYKVIYK